MARTGTALVARDAELAELVAAWDTAAGGTGTVAVVSGEAGVGKSRLVSELERTVRDRGIVLRGEAVPLAVDTLGYPPFLQLLRAARRSLGAAGEHLPLEFNATFTGDFTSVLTQVMRATNHMRTPTRICRHTNNVIRVIARAANCKD